MILRTSGSRIHPKHFFKISFCQWRQKMVPLYFFLKKTNMGAHSIFNLNMGLNLNISSSTFFFHLASYCSSLNSVIWCESIFRTKLRQRTQIRHLYPNMGQKLCILSSHKLPQRFYMKLWKFMKCEALVNGEKQETVNFWRVFHLFR